MAARICERPSFFAEQLCPQTFLLDPDRFYGIDRRLHQLIDFFIQMLFASLDDLDIRFCHRMLCHKDRTAVFIRKNRSFKSSDFFRNIYNFLFIKSNDRTEYRQCADLIGCCKALHGLACHLTDTLTGIVS